jgi:hypothetical protein
MSGIGDAGTIAGWWRDDKQVAEWHVWRWYASHEHPEGIIFAAEARPLGSQRKVRKTGAHQA